MSIFNKVPYIEAKIGDLSADALAELKELINTSSVNFPYYSLTDNENPLDIAESDTCYGATIQLDKNLIRTGFVLAFAGNDPIVFLTYNKYGNVHIYEINAKDYKRIDEECSIEEVRRILAGGSGGGGVDNIEGSDTIIFDLNEDDSKYQIRLDNDYKTKVDRALVTPLSTPTSESIVAVDTGNSQIQIHIGDGLELSGDTSPYTLKATGGGGDSNGWREMNSCVIPIENDDYFYVHYVNDEDYNPAANAIEIMITQNASVPMLDEMGITTLIRPTLFYDVGNRNTTQAHTGTVYVADTPRFFNGYFGKKETIETLVQSLGASTSSMDDVEESLFLLALEDGEPVSLHSHNNNAKFWWRPVRFERE